MDITDTTQLTLEQRGFIATADDIERLTHQVIDSKNLSRDAHSTYLRALVASTQDKLGLTGRRKQPQALTPAEVTQQLEGLEAVQKVFYEAVLRAVAVAPAQDDERGLSKADMIQRRGTFARTAKASLRAFIATGHSVAGINVARVTKYQLQEGVKAVETTPRSMTKKSLSKKVLRLVEAIRARSKNPQEANKMLKEAIQMLRDEVTQLRGTVPMVVGPTQPAQQQRQPEQVAVAA